MTRSVAATSKSEGDAPALKPNQLHAIVQLLEGKTNRVVAEAIGVHPSTITTWLRENDTFRIEFEKQRQEVYQRRLQLAHKTLAEVMENPEESGLTRVKAAQSELMYDAHTKRMANPLEPAHSALERILQALQAQPVEALEAEYMVLPAEAGPTKADDSDAPQFEPPI